jgi:hypothetical protein
MNNLFHRFDVVPKVQARLHLKLKEHADELRPYGLVQADRFVTRVVKALGPWAALWWLHELFAVLASKEWNRWQGKPGNDPQRFLRGHFAKPQTIVLTRHAAKCPMIDAEDRELLDLVTSKMDTEELGSFVKDRSDEQFGMIVNAVVAELWDAPESKTLRRWLRPAIESEQRRKAERKAKRRSTPRRDPEEVRAEIRRGLPDELSKWEESFVRTLLDRGRVPSEKQRRVLTKIKEA